MLSALARSIDNNQLTGQDGKNMSGILKLAEALPHSQLTSLRWPHKPLELCMDFVPLLAFASAAFDAVCALCLRSLADNNLAAETGYINKSEVQGSSFEVGAKVTYQGREMTVSKAPDSDGDIKMRDMSEVLALAASLPECKTLTSLNLQNNSLDGDAKQAIRAAAGSRVELAL